jgi:1-aminocyclopropane-1-carboxylate deaminase
MGAETRLVDEDFDIGVRESRNRALGDVKANGGKPYVISAGASRRTTIGRLRSPPDHEYTL